MDALTDEEIVLMLDAELRGARAVAFTANARSAYELVGLLQLSLRHPAVGLEHPSARVLVDQLVNQLSAIGPVTAMTLQWGFDRGFDRRK